MTAAISRQPLPVLTSLRFFAAAEVVAGHALGARLEGSWFYGLTSAGYEAVTFFFVLSGFILTYVYSGPRARDRLGAPVAGFLRARVARIAPAYAVGLALALPFLIYGVVVSRIVDAGDALVGVVLAPVLLQSWWPPAATVWNLPGWSLSNEMFFYLCFPGLAALGARYKPGQFVLLALATVAAVAALRLWLAPAAGSTDVFDNNFWGYFPLLSLPQFIFGVALGRVFLFAKPYSMRAHALMFLCGASGVVLLLGARAFLPAACTNDAVLAVLFGMVIFGGARAKAAPRFLMSRRLIRLGEASYVIYIIHNPLRQWWSALTRGFLASPPLSLAGYLIVLTAASLLVLQFIEKPLRRCILGHREHRDG